MHAKSYVGIRTQTHARMRVRTYVIYKRTYECAHEHAQECDYATLHQCLTDITLCLSPECFKFQTPPLNTPLLDTPLLDHLVTILLYLLVHWRCRCKCRLVGEGLVIRRKEIVY